LFLFTKSILEGTPVKVFNYGRHRRAFTYVDDIVSGILRVLDRPASADVEWLSNCPDPATSNAPWRIYNIGNTTTVELLDYIAAIEKALGKRAQLDLLPLQPGDVPDAYADMTDLVNQFDYKPVIPVEQGVGFFVDWYREYYKV
jgi:UDP-glucuronate 4-epimerase